jgi:O-antigen ligase
MIPRRLMIQDDSNKPLRIRAFEIAMIGYIVVVVFAVGLNIGSMGLRTAIADITNSIAFIVVYFCAKKFMKTEDFNLLIIGILAFAVMSAIVAVYQFFVNPDFFRLGVSREAFLSYFRSNGLFSYEYDQGAFLVISIILAASMKFRWWIKVSLMAIFSAGIFLTMHRLSWVALIVALGLIWFFYFRKNLLTYIFVPLILIFVAIVALYLPWSQLAIGRFGSELIRERILSDTVTTRVAQYKISFELIKEYPLGMGGYLTSAYNQTALNLGVPAQFVNAYGKKSALIIHNGFLTAGVLFGILGLILFSLFIFTSIFEFLRNSFREGKNWYPLLMIMITFLIFNLTNDFSFLGNQIGITLAWLIGGYISVNNPNLIGNNNIQPTH